MRRAVALHATHAARVTRVTHAARATRAAFAVLTMLEACTTREQAPVGVQVSQLYYVMPAGESPAAIYLTITNGATTADTLTALESDAGDMVMIHGPMPAMATLAEIAIAAGATERLSPGGRHGMVTAPHATIERGDSITVTLRFAHAGALALRAAAIGYADVDTATAPRE